MGEIRKRGGVWWIRYYQNGRRLEESAQTDKYETARELLRDREAAISKGVTVTPATTRLSFDDAVKDVQADYTVNGNKSKDDLDRRITKHLIPYFGGRRLSSLSIADLRAFAAKRLEAGAKPGEINRELSIIRRAFNLALEAEKYQGRVPKIEKLKERNVRSGFFDDVMFQAVRDRLRRPLQAVVTFAYITGWRTKSEVLPLEWRHVDRKAGEARLEPGTTKNESGRVFPFTAALRELMDELWREHEALEKAGKICPFVFQRNGKRIRSFREAFKSACQAAGYPGRIPHDLRRSAVRNMERAGLSRSVAMQLTGHKTESVYRRYAITSEGDLREGVERLDEVATGTIRGDNARNASGRTKPHSA
jgi:integrase